MLINSPGSLDAGSVVTVNGGTLGGTGTINGTVTVNSGGTLAPGTSIGTLTLGASPTLNGTLALEIDKTGGVRTADKLVLTNGTFTHGGALVVTNTGTDTLAAGDTFNLVTNTANPAAFSGWFSSVSLPVLPSGTNGLAWNTNGLATNGILAVYTFTGTNLAISTPTNTPANVLSNKLAGRVSSDLGTALAISASPRPTAVRRY